MRKEQSKVPLSPKERLDVLNFRLTVVREYLETIGTDAFQGENEKYPNPSLSVPQPGTYDFSRFVEAIESYKRLFSRREHANTVASKLENQRAMVEQVPVRQNVIILPVAQAAQPTPEAQQAELHRFTDKEEYVLALLFVTYASGLKRIVQHQDQELARNLYTMLKPSCEATLMGQNKTARMLRNPRDYAFTRQRVLQLFQDILSVDDNQERTALTDAHKGSITHDILTWVYCALDDNQQIKEQFKHFIADLEGQNPDPRNISPIIQDEIKTVYDIWKQRQRRRINQHQKKPDTQAGVDAKELNIERKDKKIRVIINRIIEQVDSLIHEFPVSHQVLRSLLNIDGVFINDMLGKKYVRPDSYNNDNHPEFSRHSTILLKYLSRRLTKIAGIKRANIEEIDTLIKQVDEQIKAERAKKDAGQA